MRLTTNCFWHRLYFCSCIVGVRGARGWEKTGVAAGRREEDVREKSSWLGFGTALLALSASPAKSVPVNTVWPATMMRWVRLDHGVLPRGSLEGYKSCGADMEVESSMIGGGAEKSLVSAGDVLSRRLFRLRTCVIVRLCICICVRMHVCTYVHMFVFMNECLYVYE